MKNLLFDAKHIFVTAVFVSLLFHMAILRVFTFTFSIDPITPRSFFISLGSILQDSEVSYEQTRALRQPTQTIGLDLSGLEIKAADAIKSSESSMKPLYSTMVERPRKALLKSTFEEAEIELPSKSELEDILGIQVSIPERVPLKLYKK